MLKRWMMIVLLVTWVPWTLAGVFVTIDGGLGRYRSDFLDKADVTPGGYSFGGSFGYQIPFVSGDLFYTCFRSDGSITHNLVPYRLHVNDNFFGASARLHLLMFYFRLGYAIHSYKKVVNDEATDEVQQGGAVADYYAANGESERTSGILFGIGGQFDIAPLIALTVDMSRYSVKKDAADIFIFGAGVKLTVF